MRPIGGATNSQIGLSTINEPGSEVKTDQFPYHNRKPALFSLRPDFACGKSGDSFQPREIGVSAYVVLSAPLWGRY